MTRQTIVKVMNIEKPSEFINVSYPDLIDAKYNNRHEMVWVDGRLLYGLLSDDFKVLVSRLVKLKKKNTKDLHTETCH